MSSSDYIEDIKENLKTIFFAEGFKIRKESEKFISFSKFYIFTYDVQLDNKIYKYDKNVLVNKVLNKNTSEEIEHFFKLYKEGAITKEEYEQIKSKLI
jgi:hypothetical protein